MESVLRNADFIRLWTAETISQFGTQVSLLAIPLVAVTLLHATPFEVASLGTIEFLPFILFSLPIPLGSIVGGIVATALGLRTALFVGALGAFLAVIPLVITPVRTLREMPTPAEDT